MSLLWVFFLVPRNFTLFCAFRTSCLSSQLMQLLERAISQDINKKTKRFVSNAIVWHLLIHLCKTLLLASKAAALKMPEPRFCTENNKWLLCWAHEPKSCPGITPSAHRGEGTRDRTQPLLTSSGTVKPQRDPKKCAFSPYPIHFFFSY